ncbi:glycoside hydrolase family 18 [Alistipes sp.]|uniref:glycoside hydrolase family 18 n=1 Tax=Alistipes sp. TaxID=1872444 RepID=UPI003AEF9FF3
MKKITVYTLLLALTGLFFACEKQNTPEPVRVQYPEDQSPILRDNAYYARLRAYKKTPHKLAFGWYGSWTAISSSKQNHMSSVPDSMDIISVWSQWHSLTPEQIADKAFVQQVLGAKVVFCISAKDMPEVFKVDGQITEDGIIAYAKAWGKDSMDKYQYDGMDIDFETAIDHQGPMNTNPANFKKFAEELSKYIGPKSGTGRLFLIDGNVDSSWLPANIAELCDYAVSQAYNCYGASDLEDRTASAGNRGWRPEQMIFTENFESNWQSGGPNYTCSDGVTRPSLLGMADFAKTSTSAGFGSYHMEYEYGNATMQYKHMRQAIQLANPAPQGDYTKNLVTLNEAGEKQVSISKFPSGASEAIVIEMTAKLSGIVSADTDIPMMVDNSLVASYNEYYYTEYLQADPSVVNFSGPLHFAAGTQVSSEEAPVKLRITDASKFEAGKTYLIPVRVNCDAVKGFTPNTAQEIFYLKISVNADLVVSAVQMARYNEGQLMKIAVTPTGQVIDSYELNASLSYGAPVDTEFALVADASLVTAYNTANGTSYKTADMKTLTVADKVIVRQGAKAIDPVEIAFADPDNFGEGLFMMAFRIDLGDNTDFKAAAEGSLVKYVVFSKIKNNVEAGVTSIDGTVIADRTGWIYSVEGEGTGAIGGLDNNQMFDGDNNQMGWYSSLSGKRWVRIDMAKQQTIIGFRMGMVLGNMNYATKQLYNIMFSQDGDVWIDQSIPVDQAVDVAAADGNKWQYVKFIRPITCRYVRMTYDNSEASASGGFIGCNEWNAIAPNN